jgi:hypothetical protein
MSYISVNGVGSSYSCADIPSSTSGSTIPVGAVVSGTTYTALSWSLDATNNSNGKGMYAYVYKFAIEGDATTEITQVSIQFLVNGGAVYTTEVLVATILPDANPHNFTIAFPFLHDLAITDIVTITLTATISAGTLPSIPTSNTNIYKIA